MKIFKSLTREANSTFSGRLSKTNLNDLQHFVRIFYGPVSFEDLKAHDSKTLVAVAYSMWKLSKKRKPKQPTLRVYNPTLQQEGWQTPHTVIQIVNDDMPFLVDSITHMLTSTLGLRIHVMNHPLMIVNRGQNGLRKKTISAPHECSDPELSKESYIYAEIDAVSDLLRLKTLEKQLLAVLREVRLVVSDWRKMLMKMDETISSLSSHAARAGHREGEENEAHEFLEWLKTDHFTFLGSRDYHFSNRGREPKVRLLKNSGLGILRNPKRHVIRGPRGFMEGAPEVIKFLKSNDPLFVTKANAKANVHRPVHMDYVGVKLYDRRGKTIGERQFVGLFTSQSYMRSPRQIPILRKKVEWVRQHMPFDVTSHAGKTITHILETFPRDELFLIDKHRLFDTAIGVLHLLEKPQPKAFLRIDPFERYVSAIVYVPRDSYHSGLRHKIEKILCKACAGEVSRYYALLSEDVLARWHFIIRTRPGHLPKININSINTHIREASLIWSDGLRDSLTHRFGDERGRLLFKKYQDTFSEAYKDSFTPKQALCDIESLELLGARKDTGFEIFQDENDCAYGFRLKIFHAARQIALSECLPILENLGLKVIAENTYELTGGQSGFIHSFALETRNQKSVDIAHIKPLLKPLLEQIWRGVVENDSFNALALQANLDSLNIIILRAYAKYLRQLGLAFSESYIETALSANPLIAQKLIHLFYVMFEPGRGDLHRRKVLAADLNKDMRTFLSKVTNLDYDRILRTLLHAINSTVRTNFFTNAYRKFNVLSEAYDANSLTPAFAIKLHTTLLSEAPKPRPYAEIFVYSPRLEGVHLRGGLVARGGIRWSDRREDFRTEILGLLKAQQVKNAVIVPVGAKGGFFPKRLPSVANRHAYLTEGRDCYRIFICSLLSVTDNRRGKRTVHPENVVTWDGEDSYLVVAADKGTATFSDEANSIALAQNFWLGDAFASGGSIGYDHKKIGITARGAWVSVARHFREMGINTDRENITVIGVGDMSGDVFGNGMLLSRKIKLLAAFDHRHIFFDPSPNPDKSYDERRRLFKKSGSSWSDYNLNLISRGGGVYSRAEKLIPLSGPMRELLGVQVKSLTPDETIHHLLKAKADLLWIGGIGTFVKASSETHAEAFDRADDLLRVNGAELRVKVVGEGANLGMTQKGRIEYALSGGRCNTDFIDNSAGVDCSDKEVNIKILLATAVKTGRLKPSERAALLKLMTPEVTNIVLRDNYLQTQAISIAQADSYKKREQHAGLIRILEKENRLERGLEKLPTEEQFSKPSLKQRGLSRPDLSVLVSHAKLRLKDLLLQGGMLETSMLQSELERGFPKILIRRFGRELKNHPLRRELVATALSNELVNRAGLTFVTEIEEETGLPVDQIVCSYLLVREAFNLSEIWHAVDQLDNRISASLQVQMHGEILNFLGRQAAWFLKNLKRPIDIQKSLIRFTKEFQKVLKKPENALEPHEREIFLKKVSDLMREGVPSATARQVSVLAVSEQIFNFASS